MNPHHPHHPIIYVRGFAGSQGEIEDTVADPYMGFNIGSTKARMVWTGEIKRFFFESPLVRLMNDHGYEDVFVEGEHMLESKREDKKIPYRSIIIYRYYDKASKDFGDGNTPPIEEFASGLSQLILNLRDQICADPKNNISINEFKVHLVAHSMGGLICRAFLQNKKLGDAMARRAVDKVFTYATPHNGIDMRVVRNIPGWLTFGDVNNFNRSRMAKFLGLPSGDDVSQVIEFPADRIFNLVGTNPKDYTAAMGLSSWAVGEASDGLVRIDNATTHGKGSNGAHVSSPRAFVHRSHSGHYGIVNSEEGYQNLTRFLFGALRVDGVLDIDEVTLPQELQKMKSQGKNIRASYQFEIAASVRGTHWQVTRREVRENSEIFRQFDELFPEGKDGTRKPDRAMSPHLFSIFLDPEKSVKTSGSVSFAFDLKVLVPDYQVDGILFLKRHYEGGFLYDKRIIIEAIPDKKATSGWKIKYGYEEMGPGRPGRTAETALLDPNDPSSGIAFTIPVEQPRAPGILARLRIEARPWS